VGVLGDINMQPVVKVFWEKGRHARRIEPPVDLLDWRNTDLKDILINCRAEGYNTIIIARPQLWLKTYYKVFCVIWSLLENPFHNPGAYNDENPWHLWSSSSCKLYYKNTTIHRSQWTCDRINFDSWTNIPIETTERVHAAVQMIYNQGKEYFTMEEPPPQQNN